MRKNFIVYYVLLVALQALLCNYFHFTPYLTVSILPVCIMCIPTKQSTISALAAAFFTGLVIDLLADGVPGLNTAAILPVALFRSDIFKLVFGDDVSVRGEDFTVRKYGFPKVSVAMVLAEIIFLSVYIFLDCGHIRPFGFVTLKFLLSVAVSTILAVFATDIVTSDTK